MQQGGTLEKSLNVKMVQEGNWKLFIQRNERNPECILGTDSGFFMKVCHLLQEE